MLAPTRELALQVSGDLALASADMGLRVLTVYGGVGYEPQLEALDAGASTGDAARVICRSQLLYSLSPTSSRSRPRMRAQPDTICADASGANVPTSCSILRTHRRRTGARPAAPGAERP